MRYLHYNALNSVGMITDGYGNVVERRSYDTWGKQRAISWRSNSPAEVLQSAITNRGYTGHEEITEVNLIHMNGRVYDQQLGRFLSADPHIQAPYLVNSFNRYSYVMNNPLKYTDPTGFFWSEVGEAISSAWSSVTSFFSGESSSNNGHNSSNSSSRYERRNLESDGLGFTVGYIGRAIAGLFGGQGNTIHDQIEMGIRTARALTRRGKYYQARSLLTRAQDLFDNNAMNLSRESFGRFDDVFSVNKGSYQIALGRTLKFPPNAPIGVDIDANMAEAQKNWNPWWFKAQVQNKGPWDFKQRGSQYEDFGNFHYGAVGTAFGFPSCVLLNEAGIAQQAAGTSLPEWGEPGPRALPFLGTGSNGDDLSDQFWIQQGIDYYKNRGQWHPPMQR